MIENVFLQMHDKQKSGENRRFFFTYSS